MRNEIKIYFSIVALATMLSNGGQAADLSPSIQWPWSQPDSYSDIPTYDWSGGYIAIMGGYNSTNITHGNLASTLVDRAVPEWQYGDRARALAKAATKDMTANAGVYSLTAGFNMMSQRVVYGLEAEYGRFSPTMNSLSSFDETRLVDTINSTNSAGQEVVERVIIRTAMSNKTQINDFGLINARAGYAYGRFMPYALIGLGVTRINVNASMAAYETHQFSVDGVPTQTRGGLPSVATFRKDAYAATVSMGLGLEFAILDNLILRAQYNYMTAGNVKGEGLSNNIARGGLAIKF